eukprot:CAMPEP_0202463542 /NCGR_PEP_ID=MMETSP1360-20130828/58596_1 /ASSEMBLY_ACC=CAM_ASM_000848 /TAXON_ID=515479 /ORGANISM="Licmophora paradoxa, Strain CCMP2313" /LENGTH=63 /DNA_ID=CAMNT_0049086493 /DNA_START=104 /DNA_END=295 /DNA_ORIENTATION=+
MTPPTNVLRSLTDAEDVGGSGRLGISLGCPCWGVTGAVVSLLSSSTEGAMHSEFPSNGSIESG